MKFNEFGLTGKGTKEFGQALIQKAQEENKKTLEGQVVGHVGTIMMQLRKMHEYKENVDNNITLLQRKIQALNDGEFTLSPYGVITFNDKELQEAVIGLIECKNCGYSVNRDKSGYDYTKR